MHKHVLFIEYMDIDKINMQVIPLYSYVNKNAFRSTLECARLFCAWSNMEYCMSKSLSVHAKDTLATRKQGYEVK